MQGFEFWAGEDHDNTAGGSQEELQIDFTASMQQACKIWSLKVYLQLTHNFNGDKRSL